MKCPCKDCEHRTITCHGQCDEYKAWKSYAENRNAWLRGFKPHTSENLKKREKEEHHEAAQGLVRKMEGRRNGMTDGKVRSLERLLATLRAQYAELDPERVKIGDFTYGFPLIMTWGEETKLKIGKFCSIGANVQIYLGGNHHNEWCTTYPFNVLLKDEYPGIDGGVAATKGDIIIGNGVWIGNDAKIMSGVTIEDGVTVCAGAVVTKSVRAYTMVGGVPAKHLKWKPEASMTARLKWWDWPLEKLAAAVPILCSSDWRALEKFDAGWRDEP